MEKDQVADDEREGERETVDGAEQNESKLLGTNGFFNTLFLKTVSVHQREDSASAGSLGTNRLWTEETASLLLSSHSTIHS